ncbi:leucine-rich repeat LGI family member 4-like, partial [Apteryx rowi]|uniref:leucine-rich repeat LGI family member 4-like n=1 Tax=Apteryx rowi TaxID=308060 RepID=UPI000E1C77FD
LDVLAEGSFRDTPALQLLLVTAGRLGTIGDGAFAGLVLLEHLFIEDNEVGAIAPSALRGLRGLLYLSLANNGLETLPRDLFKGLETLTHLDLRGNPWRCDCRLRWLVAWLATAAATADAGTCRGPPPRNGTHLAQLQPRDFACLAHELRPFQSLPFASLAAEPFVLGGHPGVALAQPFAGACALLEWDQLAGRFRAPTIINGDPKKRPRDHQQMVTPSPTFPHVLVTMGRHHGSSPSPLLTITPSPMSPVSLSPWGHRHHPIPNIPHVPTGSSLVAPSPMSLEEPHHHPTPNVLHIFVPTGVITGGPTPNIPHVLVPVGTSPVACHPLQLGGTLVVVVAQLGGSSAVWRRAGGPGGRFVRLQALGAGRLRRPHAVTSARLGGHWFLGVADSSKGGTSTLFRWGGRGFYPHQALRPWHRDTHLEFLELGGRPALVVCSGARRPSVYRWSGTAQVFAPHTDIPHVPDVYAAKHFRLRGHVFLCLSRFLGDAKVMRWEGSMFREVQQVPARGSLVFQPLTLAGQRYVVLGNDYAPSRVYRLGPGGHLELAQELMAPTPRAFAPLSLGHRHFLVASSFKGATQIYRHVTVDLGA